jgi:hypothetical protein
MAIDERRAAASSEAEHKEVLTAERTFLGALESKDFKVVSQMLHPELRYIHSNGIIETRDEYFQRAETLHYDYERIDTRDIQVKIFGETAITSGKMEMLESTAGRLPKRLLHLQYVHVWLRSPSGCRLLFRQTTRLP